MPVVHLTRAAIQAPALAALPSRLWRLYVSLRVLANRDGIVPHATVCGAMGADGPPTAADLAGLGRLLQVLPDRSVQLFLRAGKRPRPMREYGGAVIAQIPLQDGKAWPVRAEFCDELIKAFPGVDVRVEIQRAVIYFESVPQKRKTERGIRRCLYGWMRRTHARIEQPGRDADRSYQKL